MTSDNRLAVCLVCLAIWILLSSLDDLFIALVAIFPNGERGCRWPTDAEIARVPERRIAILVPLWEEQRVIGRMLERNLAAIQYTNYDFFAGAYPNDTLTVAAVAEAARRSSRVHLALVPHSGPTSKGDCLNAIFDCLIEYEAAHGVRYEVIVTHDAEDLVGAGIAADRQLVLARLPDGADPGAATAHRPRRNDSRRLLRRIRRVSAKGHSGAPAAGRLFAS